MKTRPASAAGSTPRRGELLADLRVVAMTADAVGPDRLVDLAEVDLELGLAAGAADAALGIDDDVPDQAGARERRQGEQGGRRVAAGRGDQAGPGEAGAVELGQPVDGGRDGRSGAGRRQAGTARQERRRRVLEAVPGRVVGRVREPEVGAEIDDDQAALEQAGRDGRRLAVGEGQEDRVEPARVRQLAVDAMARLGEVGEGVADGQAVAVARRQADDPDAGMPLEEPDQLGADVAGRAEDRDTEQVVPARVSFDVGRARARGRHGCMSIQDSE